MKTPSIIHDVHGLVVGVVEVAERDRLVTILTAERGLITAYVNGARSLKNRYLATTQQFCYGRYTIGERSGRFVVQDVELEETFYDLRMAIDRAALASYICEVVSYTGTEQPDVELLRLVLNTLYAVANGMFPMRHIKSAFEFRVATLLGFMPDAEGCAVCGNITEECILHIPQGNLICQECRNTLAERRAHDEYEGRESVALLTTGVIDAIRYITQAPLNRIFSFKLDDDDERLLSRAAEDYLLWHVDRSFSSLAFYKQMSD